MSVEVDPSKYMCIDVDEPLDDENTVGVLEDFEPGPVAVTYSGVGAKFRLKEKDRIVGDDDSTIFVASEDGELSLGYGPHFDETIVTNLKRHQLKRALGKLRTEGDGFATGTFDVHFDHAGPIVFEGDVMVATTPVHFPWDYGSYDRPKSGPSGPSITGGCE